MGLLLQQQHKISNNGNISQMQFPHPLPQQQRISINQNKQPQLQKSPKPPKPPHFPPPMPYPSNPFIKHTSFKIFVAFKSTTTSLCEY